MIKSNSIHIRRYSFGPTKGKLSLYSPSVRCLWDWEKRFFVRALSSWSSSVVPPHTRSIFVLEFGYVMVAVGRFKLNSTAIATNASVSSSCRVHLLRFSSPIRLRWPEFDSQQTVIWYARNGLGWLSLAKNWQIVSQSLKIFIIITLIYDSIA